MQAANHILPHIVHSHAKRTTKLIAIAAGKGGLGKSVISTNLAIALSLMGQRVVLMDADLGLANIDVMLGLNPHYNLSHVLNGERRVADIALPGPAGIEVLPAASGTLWVSGYTMSAYTAMMQAICDYARDKDFLIIDTAAGLSDNTLCLAYPAEDLVVLVNDEPTALMDAYAYIKTMYTRFNRCSFQILVNEVRSAGVARALFLRLVQTCGEFLDVRLSYIGAIAYDENVSLSIKSQQPVVLGYPQSEMANAITLLADHFLDQRIEQTQPGAHLTLQGE